ncbi:MAG TPA: lysylphosphatidylglycerol synthase domain-containing protein, partial [Anaerolineales bacterium]
GFIGLLILLYWALVMKVPAPLSLWIGFLAMAAAILVFLLPVERLRLPERIHARVPQALEGWVHIRKHPLMVLKVLGIQIIMILLAAARYWLAFHMLSQDVTFGQVLLMSNASILTQVVSIAPGGLGVREAIVGGVAAMLGFDMAASVLAVGLDRLMSTAVIFLAGGASMLLLGSQLSAQSQASPDQDHG